MKLIYAPVLFLGILFVSDSSSALQVSCPTNMHPTDMQIQFQPVTKEKTYTWKIIVEKPWTPDKNTIPSPSMPKIINGTINTIINITIILHRHSLPISPEPCCSMGVSHTSLL